MRHRKSTSHRFAFAIALFAFVLASTCARPALCQDEATIKAEFANPAKKYRPMVRWWWPGDDVTDGEIKREIGVLDAASIGGAEIQTLVTFSKAGLSQDEQSKVNGFATPSFFQHVRTAAEAAGARHMWIDATFGSGWPFGGGTDITPELSSIELRFTDTTIIGPKSSTGTLPIPQWKPDMVTSMMMASGMKQQWPAGWEERFEARSKIVAVVAMRSVSNQESNGDSSNSHAPEQLDRSSVLMLTDRMQSDGTLRWEVPDGTWHIFVFRQIPTRQLVVGASGNGPQLVLDHFNEAAFSAHAARVGDPLVAISGNYIGSSLRAVFCDSLELGQFLAWSEDFLTEFKKRRGYDITPYLPILRQPGYNEQNDSVPGGLPPFDVAGGDTIRGDYWKTVSELILERFYRPFDRWAKDHKLLSRVQAHGAPGDVLKIYGDASIPETEQLGGDNTVNFMKLATSAGYDYGLPVISSESFVFRGNPNISTPESIKANSDKLLISGVNQIIYHGFPYKFNVGIKGVGWYPFRAVSTPVMETNPIWPFLVKVNEYITRLQYISQRGKSDLQVAVFRSSLNQDDTGPSPANGAIKDPYPTIEDSLTAAGYSFGFISSDLLKGVKTENETFVTKGGGGYKALLIPHEARLSPELAQVVKSLALVKFPVLFVGGLPGEDVGFYKMEDDSKQVDSDLRETQKLLSTKQVPDARAIASYLGVLSPQLRFVTGEPMPFLKKTIGDTNFYFLTNPQPKETTATIEFPEQAAPETWDSWTGETCRRSFTRMDNKVSLEVKLSPYGSELIAFSAVNRKAPSPTPKAWRELKRQEAGEAGWSVHASGNSEKGTRIELNESMTELADWLNDPSLHTFSGRATYTTQVLVSAGDLKLAQHVLLDLGTVKDAAEVKINGIFAGMLIVQPFAVEIRPFLHTGENKIEVTVANTLTNYVSSLQGPAVSMYQTGHFPPVSAGLLGPVELRYEAQ